MSDIMFEALRELNVADEGVMHKPISESAVNNPNRLIMDICTPTRDRRPTTAEDVEKDIMVENLDDAEEVYNELLYFSGMGAEEDEIEDEVGTDLIEKIRYLLGYLEDPGDGSPNILYCCVEGNVLPEAMPYDCLDGLNLDTCSREEIVRAIQDEFADFDES